jgi:ADP-ribose pyrophosphatase YjhB (NUDIX family)
MKFIWHKSNSFLSLKPITQVYCVCFDDLGNVLIKREPGKLWNLPGGTIEYNETPVQTLERELEEEVDVVVGDNKMIGYYKVVSNKPTIYQLRFAAMIHKLNTQTKDPDIDLINERKLVKPNKFFDYVKIEDYRPMLSEAIKWFEKK